MSWYTESILNIVNNVLLLALLVKYRALGKSETIENCSYVSCFHLRYKNYINIGETPPRQEKLLCVLMYHQLRH
jgi:hypothetical protein